MAETGRRRGLFGLSPTVRRPLAAVLRRLPSADAKLLALAASPEVRANPWSLYRRLRETRPVYRSRLGAWIVADHAGVNTLLRPPGISVDEAKSTEFDQPPASDAFSGLLGETMLFRDPPDHERLRRLVARAFTPRRIEELVPRVEALTCQRFDALAARDAGTKADVLADLAYPLTVDVICELLGIPSAARGAFPTWARALATRMDIQPVRTPEIEARGNAAATEFATFIDGLITDPGRRVAGGLIDSLVAAEEAGDRLTHEEVISTCALLVFAGHETTANLLGNGILTLLGHPEQLRELRAGRVSMANAVEELLRHDGPVQLTQRIALTDLELGGHTIAAGEIAVLLIGSANRDPAVFDGPDRLDLARDPNPHLAFGVGIHSCLGAALARMEAAVVLTQVIERWPGLCLAGRPKWRDTFVVRALNTLPVAWNGT